MPDTKYFTVLLGCYGDYPQYSIRAMTSISNGRDFLKYCDVVLGLNECGPSTVGYARNMIDSGSCTSMIQCKHNLNKDPMMRVLIEVVHTPYFLWMDDDSFFLTPRWPEEWNAFFAEYHEFDVAGRSARWGPYPFHDQDFLPFARARPWWRDSALGDKSREWIDFVLGGLFVMRTQFARKYEYPDRGMVKCFDDVVLGELVRQSGGRMLAIGSELLKTVAINQGDRRGVNYDPCSS